LPSSAADVIELAFRHTKEQLCQPWRFAQWARLAFVGLLAGEMGSFNGCNFNIPWNHHQRGTQHLLDAPWPVFAAAHPALLAGLVAAFLVSWFGYVVLFTYIASVMRFILFDSVVERVCHIRRGWSRRRHAGIRLFCWQIFFMLASLAVVLIVIGIPVAAAALLGWLTHGSEHVLGLVLGGVTLFLLLMVLLVAMGVVHVMTKDFVLPQMALEDISALEGWRRLWPHLAAETAGYAGYVGMKIVLAIGAAIAFGVISVIALLVLLIPIGGVGALAVLGGKAAEWDWNVYTITVAVAFGCVSLAILIFAMALIFVPVVVFFPAYAIYFFAPRYPALAALLWPPPATSEAPPEAPA
jgi:small-conductance mechanosensitive channel